MASPIAHSLTGFAIYAVWRVKNEPRTQSSPAWRTVVLFALMANLPDFDFILGWIFRGDPNAWHHTWSHSLTATVAASMLAACLCPLPGGWRAGSRIFFLLIGSHLAIDFFTGPDLGFRQAFPMPLLWPFVPAGFRAPVTLFPGIQHSRAERLFGLRNAFCAVYEIALFTPLALTAWFATQPRPQTAATRS